MQQETETRPLSVFTNGTDTVVAVDAEDALHIGASGEDAQEYLDYHGPFELVPPDKELAIGFEDEPEGEGEPDVSGLDPMLPPDKKRGWTVKYRTTAQDWARRNGRGMLCSTEF